ncbi:MAG: AmmeMemoRadiSam system protein B [Thaumarchaeota archaeon]|jgi:AmmeMemoRadiSam system protein B|nr:AmmeMemoRadiSam system protein B [Nitrososphaerota archaeon]
MVRVRKPAYAGSWYEGTKESLLAQLHGLFKGRLGYGGLPVLGEYDPRLLGLMVPHAGYVYSGMAATWAYGEAAKHGPRDIVVVMGPDHHMASSGFATMSEGVWRTPLGDVEVDRQTVSLLLSSAPFVEDSFHAHAFEHSVEIQLPFLQLIYGSSFKLIPIIIHDFNLDRNIMLGKALYKALEGKKAIVLASSDMSHYVPAREAEENDMKTIRAIESLDEKLVHSVAVNYESLCGLGPVIALVSCVKEMGCSRATLLKYYSSGEITADYGGVVGYASVAFFK